MTKEIKWLDLPKENNYKAALSFLSLLWPEGRAESGIKELRISPVKEFLAKDILRASSLSLLGTNNDRIRADLDKIHQGTALSPILLVRDEAHGRVIIADGYHRLSALYKFNESCWVKCKII